MLFQMRINKAEKYYPDLYEIKGKLKHKNDQIAMFKNIVLDTQEYLTWQFNNLINRIDINAEKKLIEIENNPELITQTNTARSQMIESIRQHEKIIFSRLKNESINKEME
ncbi:unnamed protein product [Brachionus calyciflorus]|uniref:Uncharacterized protein n=1 Tax=Brachionus calyciflorus TaxID=104777 RepID=A0A813RCH9_9BILA|nr:unnamed protein product [Brachionus calyciflorus]